MPKYQVLHSTLEGIFSAAVGFSSDEAKDNLLKDLEHKPFRDALNAEITAALGDPALSWQKLLDECDVAAFDSEDQAKRFFIERVFEPATSFPVPSERP